MDLALRAMADPTRREILRLVRGDECAAGEIARHFPAISRPAVSQHLRVLKDAGLVSDQPDGTRRIYALNPEGIGALRSSTSRNGLMTRGCAEQHYCVGLARLIHAGRRSRHSGDR